MFNSLDVIIGVALLIFFVFGLKTGLLRNFLSILWVYFCVYFSTAFASAIVRAASFLLSDEQKIGQTVLALALFVILYFLGEFGLALLKNVVSVKLLGSLDGLLGGVAGAIKALLIAGFILEMILVFPLVEETRKSINQSYLKGWAVDLLHRTYPLALSAAPQVRQFVDQKVIPAVKGRTTAATQAVDLKVVTAEAGKVIGTVKRFTP